MDNYDFQDFYQRLIIGLAKEPESFEQKYGRLCQRGYNDEYSGPDSCQHNIARAFYEAKVFLDQNISPLKENWKWKNVHVNEYAYAPWSMTPLKFIWHREVPTGGNGNTPSVSKYQLSRVLKDKVFKSTHTANFKMVVMYGDDSTPEVNLMSIDTGMGGNIFGGHYFNMNYGHLHGELLHIETNLKKLYQT